MNGEQQNLVFSTSSGFWACAYSLYMRIALDYPKIIDHGSANLPESYQMDFFCETLSPSPRTLGSL